MKTFTFTAFALVMTVVVCTPVNAGHRWFCHARVWSSSASVSNSSGGGRGAGVSIKDPNEAVSPEVAEAQAQAEFEEELGERLIAGLIAKVGKQLANKLLDDLGGGLGDGDGIGLFDDPNPPAAPTNPAWQVEIRRLQGQINVINTRLGISSTPELGGMPGAGLDARIQAIELAKQQQATAEAAFAQAQQRATAAKIETSQQMLAGEKALDAQLTALRAAMLKEAGGVPASAGKKMLDDASVTPVQE